MTPDLAHLRALAEGATPGPLLLEQDDATRPDVYRIVAHAAVRRGSSARPDYVATVYSTADARYIAAASPDVVLGLIAEVRRLRTVANVAEQRCREAVPQWAPELRAALAAWRSLRGEP